MQPLPQRMVFAFGLCVQLPMFVMFVIWFMFIVDCDIQSLLFDLKSILSGSVHHNHNPTQTRNRFFKTRSKTQTHLNIFWNVAEIWSSL